MRAVFLAALLVASSALAQEGVGSYTAPAASSSLSGISADGGTVVVTLPFVADAGVTVYGDVSAQTFTSTQTDGGAAIIVGTNQKVCAPTAACAHSIYWSGFVWLTADAIQAATLNVASGTGYQAGVGVNTGHVATTGKGHDYASFDSTASPGAANAGTFPMGKAAIAATANSVVITTSAARALSSVFIMPIDADATCGVQSKVVSADGSFTVTATNAAGTATNCTATWKFNWVVFGKSQYE